MSEPTKEQRLVEWLNDRLGLVYLGLTQLSESPGYWETYYEDEIEPLESIRALIEFSGDKASGPAPTIKKDLTVDPSVEEAIKCMEQNAPLGYDDDGPQERQEHETHMAAIAVIKAALRPKVVSREWVAWFVKTIFDMRDKGVSFPIEGAAETMLQSQGIEVGEKP